MLVNPLNSQCNLMVAIATWLGLKVASLAAEDVARRNLSIMSDYITKGEFHNLREHSATIADLQERPAALPLGPCLNLVLVDPPWDPPGPPCPSTRGPPQPAALGWSSLWRR